MLRFAKMLAPFIAVGYLTGCGSAPSQLNESERASPYEIDFVDHPSYLPSNFIALTFDDVPDWNNTSRVLDVLRDKGVKATFFINTYNWSDVANEQPMQALIQRMANEGHEIGNHTARHQHLPNLSAAEIESEITAVELLARRILGNQSPPLTLLRAPFGEPYQFKDPNSPDYQKVSSVVARHAVHIGWAMDAFDWQCGDGDSNCVYNNVMGRIDDGAYGIVLMHAVYSSTANALPRLIDTLRRRGFVLGTVEDALRARFGATSRQLLKK